MFTKILSTLLFFLSLARSKQWHIPETINGVTCQHGYTLESLPNTTTNMTFNLQDECSPSLRYIHVLSLTESHYTPEEIEDLISGALNTTVTTITFSFAFMGENILININIRINRYFSDTIELLFIKNVLNVEEIITSLEKKINDLEKTLVPAGGIIMWSGNKTDIPDGWVLCDGTNGTPDLSDRFVVSVGSSFSTVGETGGTNNHNHEVTVDDHELTLEEIPSHSHTLNFISRRSEEGDSEPCFDYDSRNCYDNNRYWLGTSNTGGGNAHNHQGSSTSSTHIPPYYVLAFIMKQ